MGLFDSLKSEFGQLAASEAGALLGPALNAAGLGSLQNVIDQLNAAGLGQQVQSWAHGGAAQPITADELKAIVNIEQIKQLAQHFGVDPSVALDMLAKFLPQAVSVASQHGLVSTSG